LELDECAQQACLRLRNQKRGRGPLEVGSLFTTKQSEAQKDEETKGSRKKM